MSEERGKAVKQEQLKKKQGTFMSEERGNESRCTFIFINP
jgi:hypothetical protein